MGTYTVYKHTSPNGKVYIGITKLSVERRWQEGKITRQAVILIMP